MKAICYTIYLEQPFLATSLMGDPNSSVSFDYIPGSLVRGMLIGRYLKQHQINDVASDTTCRRLFFSGDTRYLHAYPYTEGEQRSLPTPRSFHIFKNASLELKSSVNLFDAGTEEWDDEMRRELEADEKDDLKPVKQPFCTIDNDSVKIYRPKRTLAIHIQRDLQKGRAHRKQGEIFQYNALEAYQWFSGVILVDHDDDVPQIIELLKPDICWMGRSRSANYGKVRIANVRADENWREIQESPVHLAARTRCTVTLLSDTLLRDPAEGTPLVALDNMVLSEYLGVDVEIIPSHTFTAVTAIGGFNRAWQLPLVQTYVLVAGSTIAFEIQQDRDVASIQRLEQQGIGERRVEGFGRLVFNWQTERDLNAREGRLYSSPLPTPGSLSPIAKELAQRMAQRSMEAAIEEQIVKFVQLQIIEKHGVVEAMPENSQLSRLRVIVRRALPEANTQAVLKQFKQFRSMAAAKFMRARIEGVSLAVWIEKLLDDPASVWSRLASLSDIEVADQQVPRDAHLADVTALKLLSAILAAPIQQRKKEQTA